MHYLSKEKSAKLRGVALVRLDFNTKDGDWRMAAIVPTMRLLAKSARAVVVMSHRGRPEAVVDIGNAKHGAQSESRVLRQIPRAQLQKFSLKKDAADLSRLIGRKVVFIPHFDIDATKSMIAASSRGSVFLLENMRFIKGETENRRDVAKWLASLGDYFVNDAFAVSHRAESSLAAITEFLPGYAGLELEQEIKHLSHIMAKPKQPLVLILGGAKAGDKLGTIIYFEKNAKWILLGGGAANTILAMRGMDVKQSLRDDDTKDMKALRTVAMYHNVIAPVDYVWGDGRILDIGLKSVKDFQNIIMKAKTIVWGGPLGMTDRKQYEKGTLAVARAIVAATKRDAFSLAGGGETVAFLKKHNFEKKFSFISTGGGAMLDFLAGKKLPGVEALRIGYRGPGTGYGK